MKQIIIDNRMREIEKQFFKQQGYELIEIKKAENVYVEISSHVDVFCSKINDSLIVEPTFYEKFKIPNSIKRKQ